MRPIQPFAHAALLLALICSCDSPPASTSEKATSGDKTPPAQRSAAPQAPAHKTKVAMNSSLAQYIEALLPALDSIPAERKQALKKLALFTRTKLDSNEPAQLTFICTHNSRRSHMGQLWAAVAAEYYGVSGFKSYSGGTEATAFNPRAVAALRRAGFEIDSPAGDNPRYSVSFAEQAPKQECFSKKYDDPANPQHNFAAVMTCSEADKNCPVVAGASLRVAIPYEDPKASDGSPQEAATYDERVRQIATEMFYLLSQVRT